MCKRYYSNYDEMKDAALSYRQDWFKVERHTAKCECGTMQTAFTISDREDGMLPTMCRKAKINP